MAHLPRKLREGIDLNLPNNFVEIMTVIVTEIMMATIMIAAFISSASEYPADRFFRNIPASLFIAVAFVLAGKVVGLAKRWISNRFKLPSVVKALLVVFLILAAYFYWILLSICAGRIGLLSSRNTEYDNKYVFLDESDPKAPKFKTYPDLPATISALKAKEVKLKDWIIVFTDDHDAVDITCADDFIKAMISDNEEKRQRAITIAACSSDILFKKGFVCSTFPSAKNSDDVYERIYADVGRIIKSFSSIDTKQLIPSD